MRGYLAIGLPETARKIVTQVQRSLEEVHGIRLTPPETCHLTLKFLGEVSESQAAEFCDALEEIREARFRLSLRGLGAFPGIHRPRVIWLGVSEPPELVALAKAVDQATARIVRDKPFVPHITVARLPARPQAVSAGLLDGSLPPCAFDVSEFAFMESLPSSSGTAHQVVRRFALIG